MPNRSKWLDQIEALAAWQVPSVPVRPHHYRSLHQIPRSLFCSQVKMAKLRVPSYSANEKAPRRSLCTWRLFNSLLGMVGRRMGRAEGKILSVARLPSRFEH